MPDGQSLEFSGVTKRFGAVAAVSDLTARVEPGRVTGFLGPNGAGKTTTLRILLGLVRATSGHATIGGRRYAELDKPLQTVGAVLEASSFHPGRTGAAHLAIYAQAAGIPKGRVDEVLGLVGLADAGGRKVGGYSLGMRQRLGLAYALLGDPGVLVLDEPANGLDPEGIRWMRGFLRRLAAEGRTVLVSSHLLAEVQQTVDALLIISRGRLVFEGSIDDLADPSEFATVVDAPDRAALTAALSAAGLPYEVLRSGLTVRGADPTAVGAAAAGAGVALSALQRRGPALEEVFLDLVNGTRVHPSAPGAGPLSPVGERTEADPSSRSTPETRGAAAAVAAAAAATAAAPETPVAGGVAPAAASSAVREQDAADQAREADDSVLTSAELDAEATGAPGAAAALGVAAAAAWAAEREDDTAPEPDAPAGAPAAEREDDTAPEPDASTGAPPAERPTEGEPEPQAQPAAEAATVSATAREAEPEPQTQAGAAPAEQPAEGEPEPQPQPEATAAEHPAEGEPEPQPQPEAAAVDGQADATPEPGPEPEAQPTGDAGERQDAPEPSPDAEPAETAAPLDDGPEAAEPAVTTGAGFAVASTGVIDIVPPAEAEDAPGRAAGAPEDADPDVEALGEIDDELSNPEPPDEDDDRPWENYVKTDADVEADAFFAAFDTAAPDRAETAADISAAHDGREPAATEPASHEQAADDATEAWAAPKAEGFEDAQPAASAPSPDDPTDHDGDPGAEDHEGGER